MSAASLVLQCALRRLASSLALINCDLLNRGSLMQTSVAGFLTLQLFG